jgi:D-alanyl-D-alanine carboxypeptidase
MRIFRAVIAYPDLRKILSTKEYEITTASGTHILRNHNRLLGFYPGMGPAKTGWTEAARHTYAAAATRMENGKPRELQLIILDSPDKWTDAQILFNWGFSQSPPPPVESAPESPVPAP